MPQQIGWSVEAKLLYEIKQLTKQLSGREYIAVYANFAAFPIPGVTGTLYVDQATGDIYVWNGTSYVLLSSGITALNGLIAAAQLFATGSAGTDFNISSVGTTHTFNIPTASAANRGLLSNSDWTTFNSKVGGTGASGQIAFFNGTSTVTGDNSLFWDNTNKRLGILNNAPLAPLHVGNRNATGSTDPLILASRTINSGTGNSRGFSDSTNYARSGGTSYASYDARVDITGVNNFGHYAAFQSGPTLNFTGTITDVFNYVSSPTYTSGTVTNSYGTYVQNPVKTGATLTNNYGHFFPSVFNAGTNNWVWYNSSTERSYSAGDTISRRFFAGSNSVATPSAQFHADGSGDIRLRLQQSGFNYWDFTSVSGTTYATIGDVSGTYMTFFNLGNVALGSTTNAGYKLDIQGTLRNTTSAYFATSSGNVGIGTTSPQRKVVSEIIGANDFNFAATSASLGTIGNWVGYLYGFAGNTYQKGATFFESIDANARGNFHIALNNAATSANVTLADARLTVTSAGNIGFTQTTFGTSATRTLAISTGVAPTTSPVDAIQMYSADVVAGNAAPHFRTENGAVVKVYQETTGVGAATFVQGSVNAVYEDSTFDGYTLKQIVKALRNQGLLA